MHGRSAHDNAVLPMRLRAATPRRVRLNSSGMMVVIASGALILGGLWVGTQLYDYAPAGRPLWPAFGIPIASLLIAFGLVPRIRRQTNLLAYGRPAIAVVTKVEKKRSDKGTHWRVHYEWRLLSGARRTGHYNHGKKQPPDVGQQIPIVYDRDQPARHSKYPLPLVRLV